MQAIILAAGIGKRLNSFTRDPKCLIKIKDEPLIVRSMAILNGFGIDDIVVVVGYRAEKVIRVVRDSRMRANFIRNKDFEEGSILSLWRAAGEFKKDILIMDADIYFEAALVEKIVNSKKENFFLIDAQSEKDAEAVIVGFEDERAVALERGASRENFSVSGEWAGFLKLSETGAGRLKALLQKKVSAGEREIGYEFIIPELFEAIAISYELTGDSRWVEIDFPKDVEKAGGLGIPEVRPKG